MKSRLLFPLFLVLALPLAAQPTVDAANLDSYRPWVRWWWNGDKVDSVELVRELHLLKDAGIGGVEINPIEFPASRCFDLGKPSLTWLSDEWIEALGVALREAKRLGMGCDLLVGSGWPFGSETLPMEDRAQVMLTYAIPFPEGSFSIAKDSIFRAVDPKVTVPNPDRTFELVSLKLAPDTISSLDQIIDIPIPIGDTLVLSDYSSPSAGHYFLYALVRVRSFACVINGAPGAAGSIVDHMNAEAVKRFLNQMLSRLEAKLGPMKEWLRAYFVDSMELEGCNWTDDMAAEFRKRRGYDLMPWLPFMMFKTGRLGEVESYSYGSAKSADFQERLNQVRYDFELTKAELLHERYTQTFLDWCHKQGVKARAQAYGRGFFPLESSMGYDIPEGESWTTNYLRHRVGYEMGDEDYRRGRAYTMINKYVSSAAHLTGNRLVSAEEMTNTYMLFNTSLELLKLGSDMSAFSGVTHSVWHGFNYNPPEAGFPGWVQYGSYLNEKNTWWPYFRLLNDYRARMSAILQNAEMQTDIAIIPPTEDLWAECGVQTEPFPNYPKGSIYEATQLLWEAVHKNGGNCDLVSSRLINARPNSSTRIDNSTIQQLNKKNYHALLISTKDSGILLRRVGKPDVMLPLPDSNHYLEWYAAVQDQYHLPHAVSIVKPDRFLLQSHFRNDAGEDIFLFLNAHIDQEEGCKVKFPRHIYRHRAAWIYDCNTGEKEPLYINKDGRSYLHFAQSEMKVVIFNKDFSNHYRQYVRTERRIRRHNNQAFDIWPIAEPTHWQMHLHHAIEGWDTVVVTDKLCDLRRTDFRDFAGTISYTTTVTLDSSLVNSVFGYHLLRFHTDDIAEVSVNGRYCATIWHGNRQCNIPNEYFRLGDNTIEIKVTTLLNNYVHTLTDDKVIQHFVLKRNIPTYAAGLRGGVYLY
ncbi:MAG: glycoside hydrolase family 2 [Bacteroidales bacterium]|nr:glycoside hydrolase family 2 [Candidatus Colimorpha pelethequi]